MLYGRLLDNNSHCCESLADLSYPVVLLQGRKGGRDCFVECLGGDLYGVLNISHIFHRNSARSENRAQKVYYIRLLFAIDALPMVASPPWSLLRHVCHCSTSLFIS